LSQRSGALHCILQTFFPFCNALASLLLLAQEIVMIIVVVVVVVIPFASREKRRWSY
jgi:hypothetical protein